MKGTKAEFRLIIFRPHTGEAFVGKVKSQSSNGIAGPSSLSSPLTKIFPQLTERAIVSLGFFDDIVVPPNLLPEHSVLHVSPPPSSPKNR